MVDLKEDGWKWREGGRERIGSVGRRERKQVTTTIDYFKHAWGVLASYAHDHTRTCTT
jgi:alkyl hydroperoxide reductase subunit AhpC